MDLEGVGLYGESKRERHPTTRVTPVQGRGFDIVNAGQVHAEHSLHPLVVKHVDEASAVVPGSGQGMARPFASLKLTSLRESSCQSDRLSVLIASQMVSLVTCWSFGFASRHS